jgi:pimeloyl-ACP methyl ester carboxylesterase
MEWQFGASTIFYEEHGTGNPILMLHGWPLDHRSIAYDMEPLFVTRPGWRRLYLDLPGMGKTRAADTITSQDQVLDLMLAFLDQVAPSERFVVVGYSYGGYLARGLVHQRGQQIDGLFLYAPTIETDATKRHLPQHQIIHEDAQFLAALEPDEQDLRDIIVTQRMDVLESIRQFDIPAAAEADHAFLSRLQERNAFSFDVDALAVPFPAPALFLTGRFDHWCGYREAYQLLDLYPRASFAVLDGAGHGVAREQRGLFQALGSEWLDRVEAYRDSAQRSEQ